MIPNFIKYQEKRKVKENSCCFYWTSAQLDILVFNVELWKTFGASRLWSSELKSPYWCQYESLSLIWFAASVNTFVLKYSAEKRRRRREANLITATVFYKYNYSHKAAAVLSLDRCRLRNSRSSITVNNSFREKSCLLFCFFSRIIHAPSVHMQPRRCFYRVSIFHKIAMFA